MKLISVALKTHLANPVTTLATCWHIIRMDGTQYAFTSFDSDLVIGGITYASTAGFSRTAITTGSGGEVDNVNVVGFFRDDGITERDIKNGLFDYASIYLFCVNWADLTQGICKLRRGWIGECTLSPSGAFIAELRGLTQALVQEFGNQYMPICRADLGDGLCKVPIMPPFWYPGEAITKGTYRRAFTQPTDALMVAIFQAQNDGTTATTEPTWDTIIGNTTADNDISWLSQPYWRTIGSVDTPISAHQFISTPLSIPANSGSTAGLTNTATVDFRQNVSAGTSVVVTDGVVEVTAHTDYDVSLQTAADWFYRAMSTATWSMTVTRNKDTINFVNNSGAPGNISKVGDSMRGIVIRNFEVLPFDGGTVTWIDGENAGRSMEMKTYDTSTNTVTLWLGMYYPIAIGDRFFVYPGCDKRRDTCFYTFNNILNFRAEPDMPMLDRVLSYPDA